MPKREKRRVISRTGKDDLGGDFVFYLMTNREGAAVGMQFAEAPEGPRCLTTYVCRPLSAAACTTLHAAIKSVSSTGTAICLEIGGAKGMHRMFISAVQLTDVWAIPTPGRGICGMDQWIGRFSVGYISLLFL